jgi:hypothetical protein
MLDGLVSTHYFGGSDKCPSEQKSQQCGYFTFFELVDLLVGFFGAARVVGDLVEDVVNDGLLLTVSVNVYRLLLSSLCEGAKLVKF